MSMDVEDVMKRVLCPVCEKWVEDYAPGVSSVIYNGQLHHPHCAPKASAEYAKAVHDRLTLGPNATRSHSQYSDSLLDEEETDELVEAYLLGTPAIDFAKRLENRDIAAFERACDPYPQREYPEVAMN